MIEVISTASLIANLRLKLDADVSAGRLTDQEEIKARLAEIKAIEDRIHAAEIVS